MLVFKGHLAALGHFLEPAAFYSPDEAASPASPACPGCLNLFISIGGCFDPTIAYVSDGT